MRGSIKNLFKMTDSTSGQIPKLIRKPTLKDIPDLKIILCPGRGFPYNYLSNKIYSGKRVN